MGEVIVVVGTGQIGQAIARRVSFGKHVLLADLHRAMPMRAAGADRCMQGRSRLGGAVEPPSTWACGPGRWCSPAG